MCYTWTGGLQQPWQQQQQQQQPKPSDTNGGPRPQAPQAQPSRPNYNQGSVFSSKGDSSQKPFGKQQLVQKQKYYISHMCSPFDIDGMNTRMLEYAVCFKILLYAMLCFTLSCNCGVCKVWFLLVKFSRSCHVIIANIRFMVIWWEIWISEILHVYALSLIISDRK